MAYIVGMIVAWAGWSLGFHLVLDFDWGKSILLAFLVINVLAGLSRISQNTTRR